MTPMLIDDGRREMVSGGNSRLTPNGTSPFEPSRKMNVDESISVQLQSRQELLLVTVCYLCHERT